MANPGTKPRTVDTHTHILTVETAALLTKAGAKVTITPEDAESAALNVGGTVYRSEERRVGKECRL